MPQNLENIMQSEALVCPRLAVIANARSASAAETTALLKAGLVNVAADSWLSITEKGRALLKRYGYSHSSSHGWLAGAEAQRPFHYIRTHKPTGSLYMADFNGTHHPMWGGEEWRYTSVNTLERIAAALIDRWNCGPENELWSYHLSYGPAPSAQA
jgi:hypothetical protein